MAPHAELRTGRAASSVDRDFYRMVFAPLLVTAAGSFAITAAVASHAAEIRTPAAQNLNFPHWGAEAPSRISDTWQTYEFSLQNLSGIPGVRDLVGHP